MNEPRRLLLFALVCVWAGTEAACAAAMPAFRAGTVEHGRLERSGNLWVLSLDGSPEQRGQAAGALVGEQVRWLLPRYLRQVASIKSLSPYQQQFVATFAKAVPAAHLAELNALADAAGVERTTLLAVNLAPELLAEFACSCLATTPERSSDGRVRLARNLDWPGGDLLAGSGLVTIESGGGHRFASFTWPGLVGVVTGMNDVGVAVANLMALKTGTRRPQPGVPVVFALRAMLEQAVSVEQALAQLESSKRTLPQNYAIVDTSGARVVEASPAHFRVRENQAGIASITNFWYEERGRAGDARYARMKAAASGGKLGTAELQSVLASVALSRLNVQAVILEPETRTAFVARGKLPVAKGTWEKIDLSAWLRPADRVGGGGLRPPEP